MKIVYVYLGPGEVSVTDLSGEHYLTVWVPGAGWKRRRRSKKHPRAVIMLGESASYRFKRVLRERFRSLRRRGGHVVVLLRDITYDFIQFGLFHSPDNVPIGTRPAGKSIMRTILRAFNATLRTSPRRSRSLSADSELKLRRILEAEIPFPVG